MGRLDKRELYFNDCLQSLALAKDLQARAGGWFLGDAVTVQGVARLKARSQELARQMAAMGLGRLCTLCSAKPNGGCCSRAIANENDAIQLLMNLLAGGSVEICRDNGHDCCFLGPRGCVLAFKPFFCLNYDCTALKNSCSGAELDRYEKLRGLLLQEQWRLEQHLLERLTTMRVAMDRLPKEHSLEE